MIQCPMKWTDAMRPSDALREVLYPISDSAIVLAMLVFWLLGSLARAAGLLGIWLAFVLLPAFFRYALYLLEARAHGRDAPALGIELFNWVENFWSLFPLLLMLFAAQFVYFVATQISSEAAILISVLLCFLLPASMGILGVTRSPFASISPIAISKLIKTMGPSYLWAPAATAAVAAPLYVAVRAGLPPFFANLGGIYVFFMGFTLTGALLKYREIDAQIDIPEPLEADEDELAQVRATERSKIANHAYGFVSRGNRSGGLQHIRSWLDENDQSEEATNWFINEMFKWESPDAALLLAQEHIGQLLAEERDVACIKLLSRCLLADERFRPQPGERDAIIDLLRRHGRQDLLRQINARV
jgi:hypothetical protein